MTPANPDALADARDLIRRSSAGGLSSDRRTRLSAQALFIGGR